MNQTQKTLEFKDGRKITLIGTAHVSQESITEVTDYIRSNKPDCVAIELDNKRCEAIKNPDNWQKLDIIQILKRNEGFLLLANLVLGAFQKRMGKKSGVKPGDEMVAAMKTAEEIGSPTVLVDRPIQTTFQRAWAKSSGYGKIKLLSALLASGFSKEEISSDEIEELKKSSEMDSMMKELSEYLPVVKEVLIDERDQYLAAHIWKAKGNNILAVLGAGHLNGVISHLEKISSGKETSDTKEIESLPPKKLASKIFMWIIPLLIIALITAGFIIGGKEAGSEMTLSWILWNGILAALGALIAAAHPLVVLVSFIGAPITSLCPFIGVGIVSGILQALIRKPQVKDLENLSEDAASIKGFYRNKILRILLVLFFASIGSSIGTFVAGADIISAFSQLFIH